MSDVADEPRLIPGMSLLALRCHRDGRGVLVPFDAAANVPFDLRRAFVIKADDAAIARGGHANSCHELIVALAGAVRVECDDGTARAAVVLDRHDQALWVRPGLLIHLSGFAADTVLLVCASENYADTRHYPTARPDLALSDLTLPGAPR